MKFLPLVWKNLMRRKVRTLFTLLSILIAFLLFGYLSAIRVAFSMGVELTGDDRLVMTHKVSIIQLLPYSYLARIRSVEGVKEAVNVTWFGGIYQNPGNFFPQFPVEPEEYFRMYPEFLLPADQMERWKENRTGAVVGRNIAERFGWKIGDRIPIQGTYWRPKAGGATWEFTIDGIYDGKEKGTDTTQFLFHYDYFDENRSFGEGYTGWYVLRIDDPAQATSIAQKIDAMFANSPAETKTVPEKAFAQGFANQVGNIGAILTAIVSAVFFTILLVAGNTMAQAVRERTNELAVIKTLGFSDRQVLTLVLMESLAIAVLGGALGMGLAWLIIQRGDPTNGFLPLFYLPPRDLVVGGAIVLALGITAGLVPATRAMRLRIVDALRRN
jgi:putative ABC transport system permease protein